MIWGKRRRELLRKTSLIGAPFFGLLLLIIFCSVICAGVGCLWNWGRGEISDPFPELTSIHPVFIFIYPVFIFIAMVAAPLYCIYEFAVPELKYLIDIIFYSVEIFEGTVASCDVVSSTVRDGLGWKAGPVWGVHLKEYDYGEKKRGRKKFLLPIPTVWGDETDEQTKKWTLCLAYDERPLEEPVKFLYLKRSGIIVELLHVIPGEFDEDEEEFDEWDELDDEEEDEDEV